MVEMNEDVNKHKNETSESNERKKLRKFSAKEFRAQLNGDQKFIALQSFLQQIKENSSQDCALEYLLKNGNIHELLQCMEQDSSLPPVLVLEIVNEILMKITSSKLDCKEAAYESCRYLLNNFVSALNKMLGLTSSSKERIVTLKLLTTLAAFSSSLSKDILIHVNFNLTNIELISKNTLENKTVRKHFIYFLTALLIDIEYPTLSILLEKKGMLTSIIPGLVYDDIDTVCFMLTAMKNNILENQYVSKTVKMKTFNTIVVKNIVNLYNWKGPSNLRTLKDSNHTLQVNEIHKAKVNECVHEFLLLLCTSYKHGVIFRDPLVGMGKKTQNALIFTVLDSMDSPWDHSYASDLVINICSACPDLTKYVWNNLKTYIEPRFSSKWQSAVEFAKKLLNALNPSCLDAYVEHLSFHQISQLVTVLVAPLPILKVLLPENKTYDLQIIRFNVITLISLMLKSIQNFITASENWLNKEKFCKLKLHLENYVERNFPGGQDLLSNWVELDNTEEPTGFNPLNYLSSVFDIFEHYIKLCPELLDSIKFSHSDLKMLLETMNNLSIQLDDVTKDDLQVKIIDIFFNVNPTIFALKSSSFDFFINFLYKVSYDNVKTVKSGKMRSIAVLKMLLKNTRIFDCGKENEINVWVNGIFSLKTYSDVVPQFLTASLKLTDSKMMLFLSEKLHNCPMLMGVLECFVHTPKDKNVSSYLNFVIPNLIFLQSDFSMIESVKENEYLKESLLNYITMISGDNISFEIPKILRVFGKSDIFNKFNLSLVSDNCESFLNELNEAISLYPDLKFDLFQMGIFYFGNLLRLGHNDQKIYGKNLMSYIDYVLVNDNFKSDVVLKNDIFLEHFSILDVEEGNEFNCCTNFVMKFIQHYSTKSDLLEMDLLLFNQKLCNMLFKIFKSPKKYANLNVLKVMEIFKMNSENYRNIILKMSEYISDKPTKCISNVFCSILVYCLEKYYQSQNFSSSSITKSTFKSLLNYHIVLNEAAEMDSFKLSEAFLKCSSLFTENIDQIDENYVNSLLALKEYNKSNCDLLVFVLKERTDLIDCLDSNLDNLVAVKGIFYPVLDMLSEKYKNSGHDQTKLKELFGKMYSRFEDTLHKSLKKPQKASHHLDNNYNGVSLLIELNFKRENFLEYMSKVHKFEVTRLFHVNILYTIFKKFFEEEMETSYVNNTILTFVHLLVTVLKKISKTEASSSDIVNAVSDCFIRYLNYIKSSKKGSFDFKSIPNNESFKLMMKFALKYGISDYDKLVQLLEEMIHIIDQNFEDGDIKALMEMLVTHSKFLDVLLTEDHKCKLRVLSLMLTLCNKWPHVMERSHVPILLSAYGATLTATDKITLKLLKMYESVRHQTSFYDFKPYLWGSTGATHYSVRSDIEKALFKQPRMGDVLNILQENIVVSTIKNYHLYHHAEHNPSDFKEKNIYDLEFFLPLFSHLLSPENVVQTYHFTKSGALSLTILGLSSTDENIRAAACHILGRFHFHVEGRQTGKDNLLWTRLVEVICRGISVTDELELNNFASIFLARAALILTQPNHVMYLPLTQYLAAKPTLDFSSIPELYTFLHSSDVNYKEHRNFIFEILSDGLIRENDYAVFSRSMALKLFIELYSSCTCDIEAKLLILDILTSICRLKLGVKFLCTHSGILEYLVMDLSNHLQNSNRSNIALIGKLIQIFHRIYFNLDEASAWGKYLLVNACQSILKSDIMPILSDNLQKLILELKM